MADIEIRQTSPGAFYIKVHDTDNVAIIVNDQGLKAGTRFPDGLTLIEHIPQGHKVALIDIPVRGEIIRYGEVIGYAVRDIPQGSWIDESLVELPKAPPLNTLPLANKVPEPLPALTGYTFEGYRNAALYSQRGGAAVVIVFACISGASAPQRGCGSDNSASLRCCEGWRRAGPSVPRSCPHPRPEARHCPE